MKRNNSEKSSHKIVGEVDLLELIDFIWSKRKTILIITTMFTAIGIAYALLATPWYTATIKIMPSGKKQGGELFSQFAGLASVAGISIPTTENQYNLYPEIIKSDFILNKILDNKFQMLKVDTPKTLYEFWGTEIDSTEDNWKHILREKSKIILRENYIKTNIDDKTMLLTIIVNVPEDPVLAAQLANFIAKYLDIYNKHFRRYKTSDQIKYIEKSIKKAEFGLLEAEKRIRHFLEKNKDYSSPEKKLEYERTNTEYEVQKSLYMELRKQRELAEVEKIRETETLNILEYAHVPISRYKPNRALITIISFVLGLVTGVLFVFFENTIKKIYGVRISEIEQV